MRRELEQMRKNFETMRQEYQKSMDALAERLRRLEAQPAPVAAPPRAPCRRRHQAPARRRPRRAPWILFRPRQPFALTPRRGSGQLLFDMGVAGDFVGNLTQRNVDKAGRGHVPRPREPLLPARDRAELVRPDRSVRARRGPDRGGRGDARGRRPRSSLAEAHLTLMTLPVQHPAQDGPDAQPVRMEQPDPPARPAVDRRARRLSRLLRRGRPRREGPRAHLGAGPALLSRGPRRRRSTATTRPRSAAARSASRS